MKKFLLVFLFALVFGFLFFNRTSYIKAGACDSTGGSGCYWSGGTYYCPGSDGYDSQIGQTCCQASTGSSCEGTTGCTGCGCWCPCGFDGCDITETGERIGATCWVQPYPGTCNCAHSNFNANYTCPWGQHKSGVWYDTGMCGYGSLTFTQSNPTTTCGFSNEETVNPTLPVLRPKRVTSSLRNNFPLM